MVVQQNTGVTMNGSARPFRIGCRKTGTNPNNCAEADVDEFLFWEQRMNEKTMPTIFNNYKPE